MITTYDERGGCSVCKWRKEIMKRRDKFNAVRAELKSQRHKKSAKRVLKRLSRDERTRWMTDVNHFWFCQRHSSISMGQIRCLCLKTLQTSAFLKRICRSGTPKAEMKQEAGRFISWNSF